MANSHTRPVKTRHHLKPQWIFTGLSLVCICLLGAGWIWLYHRPQPSEITQKIFSGVTYTRKVRRQPRPLVIHLISIELNQAGISFLVTPGEPKKDLPLAARTTSQFLKEFGLQVAINGDGFEPWRSNTLFDYYPRPGERVRPFGLAAARGVLYSQGNSQEPVLYISRANQARFNQPIGRVYNAISGNQMVLDKGQVVASTDPTRNPRSAVALDKAGKRLFLIAIDGRQPNYSEGATLEELAQMILAAGGFEAMNLDGGGSTALVIQGGLGGARQLNTPIDLQWPGRERPVGNHLGVLASPLSP